MRRGYGTSHDHHKQWGPCGIHITSQTSILSVRQRDRAHRRDGTLRKAAQAPTVTKGERDDPLVLNGAPKGKLLSRPM